MYRPPQRHPLLPVRPRNPTASCSAPPPAAMSNPQVLEQHSTHTLYTFIHGFRNVPTLLIVFLSGTVFTLGESGRSESRTMLRSPKEERPDITQLRKVNQNMRILFINKLKKLFQSLNVTELGKVIDKFLFQRRGSQF